MTILEQDDKAAEEIRDALLNAYENLARVSSLIDDRLSDFNSPGLRAAFMGGLKAGVDRKGFMFGCAKTVLDRWYKRHQNEKGAS